MPNSDPSSAPEREHPDAATVQRAKKLASAVRTLIAELPESEQQQLLNELRKKLHPISIPQAGDVLRAIVKLFPKRREWTVDDLKKDVHAQGVRAEAKEIYNALGYLTRKRKIQRIGYGRYIVEGVAFHASDDFGGAPSWPEIDDT
jgi:hypothetical protein